MFYRDILMSKQANKLDSVRTHEPVASTYMYKYVHKLNYEYIFVRIMVKIIIVQNFDSFMNNHSGYNCSCLSGYINYLFVKHEKQILL